MKKILLALFLSSFLLSACGGDKEAAPAEKKEDADKPAKGKKKIQVDKAAEAAQEAARQAKREAAELATQQAGILVIGDSLSSNEGLSSDQGWVGMLRKRLAASSPAVPVVNASVSGESVDDGIGRVGWQLGKYHPRVVVVALGSKDVAEMTPTDVIRPSLDAILSSARATGAQVVLAGVHAPASAPADYRTGVDAMYQTLATQHGAQLVPDLVAPLTRAALLPPVPGADPSQATLQAQPAIMETVWPALYAAMKQAGVETSLPAPVH